MRAESTVGVVVFAGFEELDAVGPYDVLQTAAREGAPIAVELLAVDDADLVTASKGLRVEPDGVLAVADAPDYLVVPGGGWNSRAETGAWAEAERGVLPDRIAACHERGTTVTSVCTGGMLLDRAGLLDGRPAVTHGGALAELREGEATVVDARVVDDGDVLTCGGVTAGIDLALWLVEREWGEDVAAAVSTELEYERTRDVYQRA
ncbi:DJ-1/PfpI family protein [Halomicrobium zhouii]|uniref:DJ-1/PfpI family protein n=1 Tax=Halomicrobium zhouii TaxID=767519 RepID=A0A1I6LGE9_9EURY|nr:DJ-1/PfpI family protein [Halomicrobium zhouii]SFS02585.1 DJ-1/PfpI family protein [Halomicrobium zhouii]